MGIFDFFGGASNKVANVATGGIARGLAVVGKVLYNF